jgi:hypothetical protein
MNDYEELCAYSNDETPNYRSKYRDGINKIKMWMFLNIWCRYLYQPITKTMHKIGICYMSPSPMNPKYGKQNYWCQWCGIRGTKWTIAPENSKHLSE